MAELKLDINLHTRYWKRCLKSVLPTQYTSTDSSRMTLGFFILSALDLLDQDKNIISEEERANIHNWVLRCQHPSGGFCGSTNHKFPDDYYVDVGHGKQLIDPPNLPATFFAILCLTYVGNLNQVRRRDCLRWLKTLQREDGSFGELITASGKIEGGRDMRHCYIAAAVRWMLRGDQVEEEFEEDINVDRLVAHIRNGQVIYAHDIKDVANNTRHTMEDFLNLLNTNLMVSSSSQTDRVFSHLLCSWIFILCYCCLAVPWSTSLKSTLLQFASSQYYKHT